MHITPVVLRAVSWVLVWLVGSCSEDCSASPTTRYPNNAVYGHSLSPIPTHRPCWIIQTNIRLVKETSVSSYYSHQNLKLMWTDEETYHLIFSLRSSSVYASKCRPSRHPRKWTGLRPSLHPRKWTGLRGSPWGRHRNRENPKAHHSTALSALRLSFLRCRSSKVR